MRNIIPNLFIIGAPKAGTTGFVTSIKQHPDIFVPLTKEPRYFDASVFYDYKEDYPLKTLETYLALYQNDQANQSKYRVDGSVFNMYSVDALKSILELSPEAKFIIILRDPLSATKSMFSQRMKSVNPALRELSESFDESWELMKDRKSGNNYPLNCRNKFLFRYDLLYSYENYLPNIISLIRKNNLYIASYSELIEKPNEFYKNIFDFLNIKKDIVIDNKKENISFQIKDSFKTRLFGYFSLKTRNFRSILGLEGKRAQYIKKIVLGRHTTSPKISQESDEDIKSFFQKTYEYLEAEQFKL